MIAFTICSNNYLAQAKTLGDSFVLHNPGVTFVIGLVDRMSPEIDYASLGPFEIIPVEELRIPEFETFWQRYNIMELNTATKPFYFKHLFEQCGADVVMYFDPDIQLLASAELILDELGESMALLTPHAQTPLPDTGNGEGEPEFMEPAFLNFGVYNLGFLAVADKPGRAEFLSWWAARTSRWAYIRPCSGLFTDQLWMNLAPVYFDGLRVSPHRGLNMAYWNLHERVLSLDPNGRLVVNATEPLVFFHFSTIDPTNPTQVTKIPLNRFTLETRPDLRDLFYNYTQALLANGQTGFSSIECVFSSLRKTYLEERAASEQRTRLRGAPVAYRLYLAAKWIRHAAGRWVVGPLRRRFSDPSD